MKTRFLLFIVASLLVAVLVVAGCGGGKTATLSTKPTTSATSITTPAGGALPTTAPAITDHNLEALTAYKGFCLSCHGAGTSNQSPMAPAWNGKMYGSTNNTGIYTIAAGSPTDHTGRTANQCTQVGCHIAPTS